MHDAECRRLPIEGPLTIYTAADSKPVLLAPLAAGVTVELDLAGVDEFDSAGLQLLLLAQAEANRLGGSLRLVAPSPAVTGLLVLANLATHFEQVADEERLT